MTDLEYLLSLAAGIAPPDVHRIAALTGKSVLAHDGGEYVSGVIAAVRRSENAWRVTIARLDTRGVVTVPASAVEIIEDMPILCSLCPYPTLLQDCPGHPVSNGKHV